MKATVTLGEVEIKIIGAGSVEFACLVHFGGGHVCVEYEYEPGQPEIIRADPDDCQEGMRESLIIGSIVPVYPILFLAERMQYTVEPGEDIFHLLKRDDIEHMEDKLLAELKTAEV
jgi:hypothetical protein